MKVAIGSDHAGYHLKQRLRDWLASRDIPLHDVGPASLDPADDYPDFARAVAQSVQSGQADLGVLVCSTGVGSCIAANKLPGIRAALCHDTFCARLSKLHNDANVLCLGANIVGPALAEEILGVWLATSFSGEDRHRRRLAKIAGLEAPPER